MSSQTVYFNNPADITALQAQVSSTSLSVGSSSLTGALTVSNPNQTTVITNLENQVDQMLINRELESRPQLFRVIPSINSSNRLTYSSPSPWSIIAGPTGPDVYSYDTDYNLNWSGRNNCGTTSTFSMILNIPSLTGSLSNGIFYNVFGPAPTGSTTIAQVPIIATGATGPHCGPIQQVIFKYRGEGQNGNLPLEQATQKVAVSLPRDWFTASNHNIIFNYPGVSSTDISALTTTYNFPPYGSFPGQADNRAYGVFGPNLVYDLNSNISVANPTGYIFAGVLTDPSDSGANFNDMSENGEFMSFLREYFMYAASPSVKTINRSLILTCSAGGVSTFDYFNDFMFKGIRFQPDGIIHNAASLCNMGFGSNERLSLENVLGKWGNKPDPSTWLPNYPKCSNLFLLGEFDEYFAVPQYWPLGFGGGYPTTVYGAYYSSEFVRDKYGMAETPMTTGTIYSNTGVYYQLSNITSTRAWTGAASLRPYPITNPVKYGGESVWNVAGINTDNTLFNYLFNVNPALGRVTIPQNPTYVYCMFCPGVYHPPSPAENSIAFRRTSDWASRNEPSLPYGLDFMTVIIDFVNKQL